MAGGLINIAKEKGRPEKLTSAAEIMIMDPRKMAKEATPLFVGADINPVRIKAQAEGKPQAGLFANEAPTTQEVWDRMKEAYNILPDINIYDSYQANPSDSAMANYEAIETMMAQINEMIYGGKR